MAASISNEAGVIGENNEEEEKTKLLYPQIKINSFVDDDIGGGGGTDNPKTALIQQPLQPPPIDDSHPLQLIQVIGYLGFAVVFNVMNTIMYLDLILPLHLLTLALACLILSPHISSTILSGYMPANYVFPLHSFITTSDCFATHTLHYLIHTLLFSTPFVLLNLLIFLHQNNITCVITIFLRSSSAL